MSCNTTLLLGSVTPMPKGPRGARKNGIRKPFDPFGYWNLAPDEEALKRATVNNILDSYQRNYDIFVESVQNAVDALEQAAKTGRLGENAGDAGHPELWVILDLGKNELTVVDNGPGLPKDELVQMLVPNLSFKDRLAGTQGLRLRGHLGVGATFLAYATDYMRVSTLGEDGFLSFELSEGRSWARGGRAISQPAARPAAETCAVFNALKRGTAVTLRLGKGTRPAALSHLGATPKKWEAILRTNTAIGFVDLLGREKWSQKVKVHLVLIDGSGKETATDIPFAYPLPHSMGTFNFLDLNAYYRDHREGDPVARKYQNQDGLWRVWKKKQLFQPQKGILSHAQLPHLHHTPEAVYAFFAHSSGLFRLQNELFMRDKSQKRAIKPGVWAVAHNAVLGDAIPLNLTYAAGNEDRLFMLVQLSDARPDLGRKGIDPELEGEIKKLGEAVIRYFVDRRRHLRPAGLHAIQAADRMAQYQRIRDAEARADKSTLTDGFSLLAAPQNESEVIGLFFELLGRGELPGYRIYGVFHNATYDGIFGYRLEKGHPRALYDRESNPLGLPPSAFNRQGAVEHPPHMMEFKVCLDSLVEELSDSRSPKRFESLALVIVWEAGWKWEGIFDLTDLTEDGVVGGRELFGATHLLSRKGVEEGHTAAVIELKKALELIAGAGDAG